MKMPRASCTIAARRCSGVCNLSRLGQDTLYRACLQQVSISLLCRVWPAHVHTAQLCSNMVCGSSTFSSVIWPSPGQLLGPGRVLHNRARTTAIVRYVVT